MDALNFRVWDKANKQWLSGADIVSSGMFHTTGRTSASISIARRDDVVFVRPTGLKDKNGDKEVYECDIIDTEGNIIGNQYETPTLLERKTNLLIQGFGTKDWLATYSQAVERGCHDA